MIMLRQVLRRVAGVTAALVLATTFIAIAAEPASAGPLTNISVTVTTTQCPRGGSVSRVNAHITQPGTSSSSWFGNTVGGLQAWYGNRSEIIGSNFCNTGWGRGYY